MCAAFLSISAAPTEGIIGRGCVPTGRNKGTSQAPVTSCGMGAGSGAAVAAAEATGGPALALMAGSALGVPGGSGGRGWDA